MVSNKAKKQKLPYTLIFDIGATLIKMMVLDSKGMPISEKAIILTPSPATVKRVCNLIYKMIQLTKVKFDRVSAGFPGVVQKGIIMTADNMHPSWIGFAFQKKLQYMTSRPSQVANDADMQGLGVVRGVGVELVITLGTGLGSALFLNGKLLPNLELAHHPFHNNQTYEALLGKKALQENGIVKWRTNLKRGILLWQQTFNYDKLYLGGGYAQKINFILPTSVKIFDNKEGLLGGIKLWEQ